LKQRPDAKSQRDAAALAEIDQIFDPATADQQQDGGWLLGKSATSIAEPLVEKLRAELRRWFVDRLDDPNSRLAGARPALDWLTKYLQTVEDELRKCGAASAAKCAGNIPERLDGKQAAPPSPTLNPLEYFRVRLDHLATRAAGYAMRVLLADAKVYSDELIALRREIGQFTQTVAGIAEAADPTDDRQHAEWLAPRLDALADEVDKLLKADCLRDQGVWATIMQGGRPRAQLGAKLLELSRQAVSHALSELPTAEGFASGAEGGYANQLRSHLCSATPVFLEHGGTRRVLAILPRNQATEAAAEALSKAAGFQLNAMPGGDNGLTLCVEAGELPLNEVAVELVQRRRDRVEFAGRIQCRSDIAWTPLVVEPAETTPSTWMEYETDPTMTESISSKTMVM
jgi:hypothetical protein